jgi:hypothetical protein
VARIDCVATSLPTMLLFTDDLQRRHETRAIPPGAGQAGLGNTDEALGLLGEVFDRDANHALVADLRSALR